MSALYGLAGALLLALACDSPTADVLSTRPEPPPEVECPAALDCEACPAGHDYLFRNGCQTCECAPPSHCHEDLDCGDGAFCAPGQRCAEGCDRLECCVNVCSDGACPGPAPEGCAMECAGQSCDGLCVAEGCFCDAFTGSWQCAPGPCEVTPAACFFP